MTLLNVNGCLSKYFSTIMSKMAASWSKLAAVRRRLGLKLHQLSTTRLAASVYFQPAVITDIDLDLQVRNHDHCNIIQRQFSTRGIPKKDCTKPMAKTHDPGEVESGWYDWWVQEGFFKCEAMPRYDRVFAMLLPPPNVTGNLHLGHALTGAIQDAIVRWHRMKGFKTLWIPGTDHAGIATHAVVERKLWREQGKTRHDLGRENFVKEIWKWKEEHGHVITEQMKMLGLSLDWSREYFTMDENLKYAVEEAFCRLYKKGLIYRDTRMINWSSALRSSLSDIEVDKVSLEGPTTLRVPGLDEGVEFGVISRFAYPVVDSEEQIIVATTRLETMLADTAVAVNPDDNRYSHLVGQRVMHPIDKERLLPIIADSFVDMSFGTGAVKITPGHDYVDHEVGRRHDLPVIEILEDDGTIRKDAKLVGGQHRFEARKNLREALCLLGYYCGERNHPTVLPVCSRSGDIVEPRLKKQWFLNCKGMAQQAIEAVESGKLKIIPEYNERIWYEWLNNVQDWCLSRQLWWGHRIPFYTCTNHNRTTCTSSIEEAKWRLSCQLGVPYESLEVEQDEDVLDTWFSSALLPFSTLNWPEDEHVLTFDPDKHDPPPFSSSWFPNEELDLNLYFPQQLIETGQDILFFWVARMVMLSLELTGKLPFNKILLHGMLRDAQGKKMSKSLGNVIDPMDVIKGISLEDLSKRLETGNLDPNEVAVAKEGQRMAFPNGIAPCGADALRLTLCSYNTKNVDINFDVTHAESKMRFCNKIWQSFKFIFSKLPPGFSWTEPNKYSRYSEVEDGTDLWILSRLSHMVQSCDTHFLSYDLHFVTSALQQFWYQEFCDVYLEAVKPVFLSYNQARQEAVTNILVLCADTFVRGVAPFMPFLCEELFQRLDTVTQQWYREQSVCRAEYPAPFKYTWINPNIDQSMERVLNIVHHVQKLRKDYQIMGTQSHVVVQTDDPAVIDSLSRHETCLLALSRSSGITVLRSDNSLPEEYTSSYVNPDVLVGVELKGGGMDTEKELSRLHKKVDKLQKQKEKFAPKLEKMVARGKGDYSEAEELRKKLDYINGELEKLSEMMQTLSGAESEGR